MKVLIVGFEYLPVKVGGLAEAITSIAEGGLKKLGNDVVVFTPDHGRELGEVVDSFRVSAFGESVPVTVRKREENGVTVYSLGGGGSSASRTSTVRAGTACSGRPFSSVRPASAHERAHRGGV